jgi:hypothetical protein
MIVYVVDVLVHLLPVVLLVVVLVVVKDYCWMRPEIKI